MERSELSVERTAEAVEAVPHAGVEPKTEEGTISAVGHEVDIEYPGEPNGIIPASAFKELRQIVLDVEKYFNEVIEKDQGHAVDMEVAYVDGKWNIVQARVIIVNK